MALMRVGGEIPPSNFKANSFLDLVPCAIGVWSADGLVCTLNTLTLRLIGYSAQDFQRNPSSFWVSRIHPSDFGVFLAARKRLESGEDPVSCEYRFFRNGSQERWFKETCRAIPNGGRENREIISVYSDVSELVGLRENKDDKVRIVRVRRVIDRIVHQITNNLQVIRGTLDCFRFPGMDSNEYLTMEGRIEQTHKLMAELSACFRGHDRETIELDSGQHAGKVGAEQED